ncbi:MAG: alpha/beta hydrolase [Methanoregulaceae archaeon]|nr:alpha/beta hydrolase [Methanoregulaceae archaeon]
MLSPLLMLLIGQEPARRPSLTGTIEKLPAFESKALGNSRDVLVYLPPNYANEPKRRYPVAYFHDGQNVFDGATSFIPNQEWRADETAEAMINAGLIEPIIIVAVANAGAARGDEFLPTRFTFRGSTIGGKADDYGRMLADEIKPEIDRRFRTRKDATSTAVIGSSFGGILSLHLGLSRPKTFGKIGVMSPSVWVDERVMIKRVAELTTRPKLKVWLDIGSTEGPDAARDTRDLRDALLTKGWRTGRDVLYFEEPRGEHNEAAWARRLPMVFKYLFGK